MENPFRFNLHSHTYRCGHALGEDEEYVLAAIKAGFKALGFSDHVMLPGINQPIIRGERSDLGGYRSSINELKKKYADQIEIHLGFECEWYRERFEGYYKELLSELGFEYLILGQHCFIENGDFRWYASIHDEEEMVRRYTDDLIAGMESGLFLYVAHPDIFLSWLDDIPPFAEAAIRRICEASVRLSVPLEVNMGPSRRPGSRPPFEYPNDHFWEVASEMGVKAIVGVDAHNPKDYEVSDYRYFDSFCKRHHLNLITDCPLPKGKK